MNKTAEVIQATRNATQSSFEQDMPNTRKLEKTLREYLDYLKAETAAVTEEFKAKSKDLEAATEVTTSALEAIQGEKK